MINGQPTTRHSGAPRSGEPGIHTPQRRGYGFRLSLRSAGMTGFL